MLEPRELDLCLYNNPQLQSIPLRLVDSVWNASLLRRKDQYGNGNLDLRESCDDKNGKPLAIESRSPNERYIYKHIRKDLRG